MLAVSGHLQNEKLKPSPSVFIVLHLKATKAQPSLYPGLSSHPSPGWFSMSPLLRLHHHDNMTIVELLHRATTKFFCHTLTQRKTKKEGKNPIPWP